MALIAAVFAVASIHMTETRASVLYGADFPGGANVYTMDQATGAANLIGNSGVEIGDMTSNPGAGILWGVDIGNATLRTFNPATGLPTGAVTLLDAAGARVQIVSIAYDVVTNTLYGNTAVGFNAAADTLYTIDPLTGLVTQIGAINFTSVFALGFDQNGDLFGVADATNELISIDTGTGAGTSIATLSVGLAFDIASRPEDDVMFLADSGTFSLYTLNTANGNLTLVGPYGGTPNIVGLAFLVPEPGAALIFLLGTGGLMLLRRRQRKAA
jgi:hypothetical protein